MKKQVKQIKVMPLQTIKVKLNTLKTLRKLKAQLEVKTIDDALNELIANYIENTGVVI